MRESIRERRSHGFVDPVMDGNFDGGRQDEWVGETVVYVLGRWAIGRSG